MEGFGGQGKEESGEGELREQKNADEGEGVTRERHGAELTRASRGVGEIERAKLSAAVERQTGAQKQKGERNRTRRTRKDSKQA